MVSGMSFGVLGDYFEGAGAKYVTASEVDKRSSNQHEFQGVGSFRRFLGESAEKQTFPAKFYWLDDEDHDEALPGAEGFCTWSDVRRGKTGRSAEYHLYYSSESEPIVYRAKAGDILFIARTKQRSLLVILCPADSTIAGQLLWLFGLDLLGRPIDAKALDSHEGPRVGFAAREILEEIGIELPDAEPDAFEKLVDAFGLEFPSTATFSEFARKTSPEVDPLAEPDDALLNWMDHEEALFRHLEKKIVAKRLREGFMEGAEADVDGFVRFSLSVHNRRKARAGWALGNHVEAILDIHGLAYKREAKTEKRNGPDFLFPGEQHYHDPGFNPANLTMLAAKTSCKDRWRQVLAEAHKIKAKHLLTLQPGISVPQTDEMQAESLQLVMPRPLVGSYTSKQQAWLIDFREFINLVKTRQP